MIMSQRGIRRKRNKGPGRNARVRARMFTLELLREKKRVVCLDVERNIVWTEGERVEARATDHTHSYNTYSSVTINLLHAE